MNIRKTVNKNTDVINTHFTENPDKVYLTKKEMEEIISIFLEEMYQSAIARLMKKNYNTVHSHIYRESKKAEEIMKKREDRIKEKRGEIISLDGMWTYENIRKEKSEIASV